MNTKNYKSETCEVDFFSDLTVEEAKKLIGSTISHVSASEYSLILGFTNGSTLTVNGYRWDDCSLGVELED